MPRTREEMHRLVERLAELALRNCTEEFTDLARECIVGLAVLRPAFDGSDLTDMILWLDPLIIPNPDPKLIAYYPNSLEINHEVTRGRQRNYFSSAARVFWKEVAIRSFGKNAPKRTESHDEVYTYTSTCYGSDYPLRDEVRAANTALLAKYEFEESVRQERERKKQARRDARVIKLLAQYQKHGLLDLV